MSLILAMHLSIARDRVRKLEKALERIKLISEPLSSENQQNGAEFNAITTECMKALGQIK